MVVHRLRKSPTFFQQPRWQYPLTICFLHIWPNKEKPLISLAVVFWILFVDCYWELYNVINNNRWKSMTIDKQDWLIFFSLMCTFNSTLLGTLWCSFLHQANMFWSFWYLCCTIWYFIKGILHPANMCLLLLTEDKN